MSGLKQNEQQSIFNQVYGDVLKAIQVKSSLVREYYEERVINLGLDDLDVSQSLCLDLGCGRGINTRLLCKRFPQVVATDFAHEAVKTAKKLIDDGTVSFLTSDANSPPFLKECFDFIVIKDLIHHLDEPGKAMIEIHALLKPGGYLLSVEPNNRNLCSQIIQRSMKHERRAVKNSPQFLIRLIQSYGFQMVHISFDGFYVPYGPFANTSRKLLPFLYFFERMMKAVFPTGGGHFISCYRKSL